MGHLKTMLSRLSITTLLLFQPCFALEDQNAEAELGPEPVAMETDTESGVHQSPKGSSLSSEDFANGAKYNEDYESQDNSSKRAHFEQAMRFQQEERYKGYNFYKQEGGDNYLFQIFSGWIASETYPFGQDSWSFGVKNEGLEACPEESSGSWQYYGTTATGESGWVADSDGALRCSDCNLFPAADECAVCCSEIVGSTTEASFLSSSSFLGSFLVGNWVAQPDDFNGHKVYKSVTRDDYCIFFNNDQRWVVAGCANLQSTSMFMYAGAKKCIGKTLTSPSPALAATQARQLQAQPWLRQPSCPRP